MPVPHHLPSKAFNQHVLSEIRRTKFANKNMIQQLQAYLEQAEVSQTSFETLHEKIIHEKDLLYRGTSGLNELIPLLEQDAFGRAANPADQDDYNLVGYVRDNLNTNFLSFSPCPETVQKYAAKLSILPSLGSILVNTYPKVFAIPQKLVHFKSPLIQADIKQQEHDDRERNNESIEQTIARNNETTAVLRGPNGEDWRLKPSTDLMKVILLYGAGRAVNLVTSASQPLYIDEWTNTSFKKRAISVEVILEPSQHLAAMSQNAKDLGCLAEGHRLITLQDADAIFKNNNYDDIEVNETLPLSGVPETIRAGDEAELVDYIKREVLAEQTIQTGPSAPLK
jgi:hypothetical protein